MLVGGLAAVWALTLVACGSGDETGDTVASAPPTGGVPTTVTSTTVTATTVTATTVTATTALATTVPASGTDLTTPVDAMADLAALSITAAPYTGSADEFAHAIADELLASHGDCEVTPTAMVSTVGESPAIATIDLTIGCDDATGGLVYTLTLDDPDGEGFVVFDAMRQSRCIRAVDGELCV